MGKWENGKIRNYDRSRTSFNEYHLVTLTRFIGTQSHIYLEQLHPFNISSCLSCARAFIGTQSTQAVQFENS